MKFFFAENIDRVDPDYNFINDVPGSGPKVFGHELFSEPPFDGLLVSRATVESSKARCTQSERLQIKREGIRSFLRFPHADYPIIGDCGSFSASPGTHSEFELEGTYGFYQETGFDYGVSPDLIVPEFSERYDSTKNRPSSVQARVEQTFKQAENFISICRSKKTSFEPIGALQFWSVKSAGVYAKKLTDLGYDYIGVGGIAQLRVTDIFNIVNEIRERIPPEVRIHLFGFTRTQEVHKFCGLGITSIDSTSPLIKSFKDDRNNLFMPDGEAYTAIRIPRLNTLNQEFIHKRKLMDFSEAERLEKEAMKRLREYDSGRCDAKTAVKCILEYQRYLQPGTGCEKAYLRTLRSRLWESESSPILKTLGIDSVILRGFNRDKRRGFHNLFVFHQKIKKLRSMKTLSVPCIKTHQNSKKAILSFVVNGKDIPKFASVSRIAREEGGDLMGYQRPEVISHIKDIQNYLDKDNSLLPNSIVIAFKKSLIFHKHTSYGEDIHSGTLEIPIGQKSKPGWIVDGQQRVAALRQVNKTSYPVSVVAIDSASTKEEREQFVLVNNVKPLPKNLIYELLPVLGNAVPPRLRRRQHAYRFLEKLNGDPDSPFFGRIRTATTTDFERANIKDVSVLKMVENSMSNGALYKFGNRDSEACQILNNFWGAISDVFNEAWTLPPKESRLTHGVGVVSCGYLMDTMVFNLSDRWTIPPRKIFAKEIRTHFRDLPWTDGVWSFGQDSVLPWNGLQNTSKHIDLLANYLIRTYKVSGINV